ncbi:hypothetical protein BGV54_12950 [Burkholderia ubonensis]|nr:hypothetical protein BGV54_12950 [Burkholderia ubonensis]
MLARHRCKAWDQCLERLEFLVAICGIDALPLLSYFSLPLRRTRVHHRAQLHDLFHDLRVECVIFTDMNAPPVTTFPFSYFLLGTRKLASPEPEALFASTPSCIVAAGWPLKATRNDSFGFELGATALVLEVVALLPFDDHLTLGDGFGRALSVSDDYQH